MGRIWDVKIGWGSLLLAMLAATVGCSGGSDKDEEEEELRRFRLTAQYYRLTYDTDKSQALYVDAYITGKAKHGGTNLARWEKQGLNRSAGNLGKVKAPGGTGYVTAGSTTYGAADPDVELIFFIEKEPGLTFYTRKPAKGEEIAPADLSGVYSCLRHFTQPAEQLQWFQADFVQDGVFQYSLDGKTNLEAQYELQSDGRFRISLDGGVDLSNFEIGEKQEALFAGGFQHKQQFLMASYMVGDTEPSLSDSLPDKPPVRSPDKVPTQGLLLCLKGDSRLTQADFQGEYWFANLQLNSGLPDVTTFGYIKADGQGALARIECERSAGALRKEPYMTYDVNTEAYDGSLVVDEGKMRGVLSQDGEVALLASTGLAAERSIEILVKKYWEGDCP